MEDRERISSRENSTEIYPRPVYEDTGYSLTSAALLDLGSTLPPHYLLSYTHV